MRFGKLVCHKSAGFHNDFHVGGCDQFVWLALCAVHVHVDNAFARQHFPRHHTFIVVVQSIIIEQAAVPFELNVFSGAVPIVGKIKVDFYVAL